MDLLHTITVYSHHGIVYGMLLFLVSAGLTVVFGMMNVLSIAHAAFYMAGAYLAFSIISWTGNFWIGLILAPIGVGIIGGLVERFLLRKVHVYGHADELLLTFGIFYVIGELVKLIWGDYPKSTPIPSLLNGRLSILGMEIQAYNMFIILAGVVVVTLLAYFLLKTKVGIIIRSIVLDAEMAGILGVNTTSIFLYVFAASSALAGLGGVIATPFLSTYIGMGNDMMIDMFIVVVVGGLGSLTGAFFASILIGLLQSFGVVLIPKLALIFQFLFMAVVLIIKPRGLFGEK